MLQLLVVLVVALSPAMAQGPEVRLETLTLDRLCHTDTNNNGIIDVTDLLALLATYNVQFDPSECVSTAIVADLGSIMQQLQDLQREVASMRVGGGGATVQVQTGDTPPTTCSAQTIGTIYLDTSDNAYYACANETLTSDEAIFLERYCDDEMVMGPCMEPEAPSQTEIEPAIEPAIEPENSPPSYQWKKILTNGGQFDSRFQCLKNRKSHYWARTPDVSGFGGPMCSEDIAAPEIQCPHSPIFVPHDPLRMYATIERVINATATDYEDSARKVWTRAITWWGFYPTRQQCMDYGHEMGECQYRNNGCYCAEWRGEPFSVAPSNWPSGGRFPFINETCVHGYWDSNTGIYYDFWINPDTLEPCGTKLEYEAVDSAGNRATCEVAVIVTDVDECSPPTGECGYQPNSNCADPWCAQQCDSFNGFDQWSCPDWAGCVYRAFTTEEMARQRQGTCVQDGTAECTNLDGSFECQCLPGYEGDGRNGAGFVGCYVPGSNPTPVDNSTNSSCGDGILSGDEQCDPGSNCAPFLNFDAEWYFECAIHNASIPCPILNEDDTMYEMGNDFLGDGNIRLMCIPNDCTCHP